MLLLFKMVPKREAKVLSGVPKVKKAMMPVTEETPASGNHCSSISYGAVGHQFNVNEPKYMLNEVSVNRNRHETKFSTDLVTKLW